MVRLYSGGPPVEWELRETHKGAERGRGVPTERGNPAPTFPGSSCWCFQWLFGDLCGEVGVGRSHLFCVSEISSVCAYIGACDHRSKQTSSGGYEI